MSDEDDYRLEVLISLRQLERLDKTHYIEEERQEALDIHEQRKLEEQGAEVRAALPSSALSPRSKSSRTHEDCEWEIAERTRDAVESKFCDVPQAIFMFGNSLLVAAHVS